MSNLYSITKKQAAIRDLFKVVRDTTGNLPPLPAIFPDQVAPVVRINEGERELTMMRWGMPHPPHIHGITTNIRNTGSSTGGDGSGPRAGASSRSRHSANTRTPSRRRRRSGSPSTRADRWSRSRASGPNGAARAARKRIRSRAIICTAS
jgi:FtsP/CotA-like multicopper oxidase with cupredoxin domain